MDKDTNTAERYRYLPFLSTILLLTIAALAVRMHLQRPPANIRRQLASFQFALEVIPKHYPETDHDGLFQAAIEAMIDSLNDPNSRYLSPSQLMETDRIAEGEFDGVGIIVISANSHAVITELLPGGSAAETNLRPGDIITGVDDRDADDMTFQQLVAAIRGKAGTAVKLTVRSGETGETMQVELERRVLEIAPVEWDVMEHDIVLIRLQSFNDRTVDGVRKAFKEARQEVGMDALILDLRDNPGGILEVAVRISDMFLSEGRIVALSPTGESAPQEYFARKATLIEPNIPVAVLVNERSASGSELLAGALQAHGRATVIGAPTFGKGSVDSVFSLPDGSGLILKIAGYVIGDDVEVDGNGIIPDIVIGELPPLPEMPGIDGKKEWLEKYRHVREMQQERAIEFLTEKLGDSQNDG